MSELYNFRQRLVDVIILICVISNSFRLVNKFADVDSGSLGVILNEFSELL